MGCKYLTKTKEALDCSKNEVLPPPLPSFYFQKYFKVHWVARTDFIVKHKTFLGMFSEKLFRWEKNNGTQNRAVAWTLVMQTRVTEDLPAPWCCLCCSPSPSCVTVSLLLAGTNPRISKAEAATALSSWKQLARQQGYYCCKKDHF